MRNNSPSTVRTSWHRLWGEGKKAALVYSFEALLVILRDRPVALFFTTIGILHFNWFSIPIIVLGIVANELLNAIFLSASSIRLRWKVIFGCLIPYAQSASGKIRATKYAVSDYIRMQYDDIEDTFIKSVTGLFGIDKYGLDNTVQIYHIQAEDVIDANLTCYGEFLDSYIFFNASPHEKMGPFQKFSFLHELAHSCFSHLHRSFFIRYLNRQYFIYLLFLLFFVHWKLIPPIHIIVFLACLYLPALIEKFMLKRRQKAYDEVNADIFAAYFLEDSEKQRLSVLLMKHTARFYDADLSQAQNEVRLNKLKDNLVLLQEKKEDVLAQTFSSGLFHPWIPLLLATCIWICIPGFYSDPPHARLLFILLIVCLLAAIVLYCTIKLVNAGNSYIQNLFEHWNSSSQ